MTRYGQTAAIAATTAGVAGSFVVPKGARLVGINLAFAVVDDIPKTLEIKWAGSPNPMKYAIPISAQTQTTQASTEAAETPLIPLNHAIDAEKTITITIVSTGNITVRTGLMWDAA